MRLADAKSMQVADGGLSDALKETVEAAESLALHALQVLATDCTAALWVRMDDAVAIIHREVMLARDLLNEFGRSTKASADAVLGMGRAVDACPPSPQYMQCAKQLVRVETMVRDVAVWRCQITVPMHKMHVKSAFLDALREAFGHALANHNFYSRLMSAHRHVVSNAVSDTFLSRNQQVRNVYGITRGLGLPLGARRQIVDE